ncbi:unnamed protein product [Didymodactylos carnosus]|uniref:Pre-rRNA-processing protein TSR2 homolog n=1 Tax=Didymodactylos carnosus TaxID=1234261 RepID=A0A814CJM5_9BILA|nr:unnamed protein product [Didymodactylos carnosus]CAF0989249.1 unnamed protein product [Didymodactylos carnosus]CAF3717599.1 unnamed protein product [Didymodactylos carnosus]CAF3759399.1 unnamed protein product [Didymodactylos carnosus]
MSGLSQVIRAVFSRWTGLQLAISNGMGGPMSEMKYEAFISALEEYLMRTIKCHTSMSTSVAKDIQEYLDDVMDDEFNTVLDDGSSEELSIILLNYVNMINNGKITDVLCELDKQSQQATGVAMSVQNKNENNESSDSDSDDEDEEEKMDENKNFNGQQKNQTKTESMDLDEANDGWVTVKRGGKKS